MAIYFIDSSALVKRYVNETGLAWVSGLFDPALNHKIFVAAITHVEFVSAITRRMNKKEVTASEAAAASNGF